MKKVKNYIISCQSYDGEKTFVVKIKLDNGILFIQRDVSDCEAGLNIINGLIKNYKFTVVPDLTIYPSMILGKMIYAEN